MTSPQPQLSHRLGGKLHVPPFIAREFDIGVLGARMAGEAVEDIVAEPFGAHVGGGARKALRAGEHIADLHPNAPALHKAGGLDMHARFAEAEIGLIKPLAGEHGGYFRGRFIM